MSDKEVFVLSDPFAEPSEETLEEILGDKYGWLQQLRSYAMPPGSQVTETWKYYNDVKQWLSRFRHHKETICWIGILEGTFRVTFYFGSKCEHIIDASALPMEVKEAWHETRDKHFRPISVLMTESADLELAKQLTDLKMQK